MSRHHAHMADIHQIPTFCIKCLTPAVYRTDLQATGFYTKSTHNPAWVRTHTGLYWSCLHQDYCVVAGVVVAGGVVVVAGGVVAAGAVVVGVVVVVVGAGVVGAGGVVAAGVVAGFGCSFRPALYSSSLISLTTELVSVTLEPLRSSVNEALPLLLTSTFSV